MAHSLTPHCRPRDFNTALIAYNPTVANTLVFTAVTFIIALGAKNTLIKKPILFRTLRTIIDGFWFYDFTVGPLTNIVRRCEAHPHGIKVSYAYWPFKHRLVISAYIRVSISACPILMQSI